MQMELMEGVVERIRVMLPMLNEKQKRYMLAVEAKAIGHGGIKKIVEISGVTKTTIIAGMKELSNQPISEVKGIRKKGGGAQENRSKVSCITGGL